MGSFVGYRCSICGKTYQPGEVTYTCLDDGTGHLDVATPDGDGACHEEFCAFDCCLGGGYPGAHTSSWCSCS